MLAGLLKRILLFVLVCLTGCVGTATRQSAFVQEQQIYGDQLLVVVADSSATSRATLAMYERTSTGWGRVAGPVPAMIGRNGFAAAGEKHEGDGKVPTGLFSLDFAFGYDASIPGNMPYRQTTADDVWVDDVNSPDYNTWVTRGETTALSYELLRRSDNRYHYGIVTGYNRSPIIPGAGSAIFVHVWEGSGFTTTGCVAVDEAVMVGILKLLDPRKKPMILMGTRAALAEMHVPCEIPVDQVPTGVLENLIREKAAGFGGRLVEYRSDNGFFGMALLIPASMETSLCTQHGWPEGCPVPISGLSYLFVSYWGGDGSLKIGELMVHQNLAYSAVKAFAELYTRNIPIEQIDLLEKSLLVDSPAAEAFTASGFGNW